ncbi:hypothetical protein BC777_0088 [Yoonia maricola]|uniref:Uncharacterized protein n=1 Tax=Yoonia maricola TaxID=420999 RepID=A0A2M8WK15_9RHOB|nr:hypothetical protein [Yoonia maricola]PJI91264.1 hypothetical protein BC777_0088 [Yoonia maricola]
MSEEDDELRWRLEVLKVQLDEGKIKFAEHLWKDTEASLSKVSYGKDGKIDLSTVDARVRSLALSAAAIAQRTQAKEAASLQDITQAYFEFVEKNLGFLVGEPERLGVNIGEFSQIASRTPTFVADFKPQITEFVNILTEFWESTADAAHYHIQDMAGTKAIFGGDLFPSYTQNIASTAGLYIDTIVLTDPFMNTTHVFDHAPDEQRVRFLVKHALNVLQYQNFATSDLPIPIVTFAPFRSSIDEHEADFLRSTGINDGVIHASRLFGREFADRDDLLGFCSTLNTPSDVMGAVVDQSRLLFDTEWTEPFEEQIKRVVETEWSGLTGDAHPGRMIAGQCIGRMGQATDLLMKSRYLSGVPFMDAPTSWNYFNWKLEYNSALSNEDNAHLHMIQGLQRAADTDEEWLGNIPPQALIEMRREGAFEEIRHVLADGVIELSHANPENFFRSTDKIVENIREAFDAHTAELKELRRKKVHFAGHDIGTMIAAGAIDIASIATGVGTFGAASLAVNQLVDVPKLREIPERFRNLKDAHTELRKSPMGLFFDHKPG